MLRFINVRFVVIDLLILLFSTEKCLKQIPANSKDSLKPDLNLTSEIVKSQNGKFASKKT